MNRRMPRGHITGILMNRRADSGVGRDPRGPGVWDTVTAWAVGLLVGAAVVLMFSCAPSLAEVLEAPQEEVTTEAPKKPLQKFTEIALINLLFNTPLEGVVVDVDYDPELLNEPKLGYSQFDGTTFTVRLRPGMQPQLEIGVLTHEWAHGLHWVDAPGCEECGAHGPCWGIQYSRAYRATHGE